MARQLVLVRWQLKKPMYDFKKFVSPDLSTFIEQNIFFPRTYFFIGIRNYLAQGEWCTQGAQTGFDH